MKMTSKRKIIYLALTWALMCGITWLFAGFYIFFTHDANHWLLYIEPELTGFFWGGEMAILITLILSKNKKYIAKYKHTKNDTVYYLISITNEQATKPEWVKTAVYFDDNGHKWSRPLEEFLTSCEKI